MSLQILTSLTVVVPEKLPKQRSLLFLIDQLTELGGAERMMFDLANSLAERGYRVTIVTFRDHVSPEAYKLVNEIVVVPMRSSFSLAGLRSIASLVRLMHERNVCLVQTYFESADLVGAIAARLAGIRNLCSSRRDMGFLRSWKHQLAYKILTPLYSRVIAVSGVVAKHHQQMDGIDDKQLTVIHNGVDLERYRNYADALRVLRSLGIASNRLLVTTVANVNRWKGLDVFIKAAALVQREIPDVLFAIAGDWTDREHLQELQALATNAGIGNCLQFVGRVENVPSLLLASNIFVLLSRSEGFPNVVIEAMAASLPVVATDVGGTSEAVMHGVTGYLVDDQDYESAARHILSLLTDARKRRSMGAKGRRLVEQQFSKQMMVKRHLEVYDAILAK